MSDVFRTLIAAGAESAQVGKFVLPSKALVDDVTDVKTNPPVCIRIDFSGTESAHLTCEAVAVEDGCPEFGGDGLAELDRRPLGWSLGEYVLSGFQIVAVIVREYRPFFIVAQFTNATGPLAYVPSRFLKLPGSDDIANVGLEELPNPLFS